MIEGVPAWLSHSLVVLGLLYASYIDIKTQEVPDILNYSMMATGVILAGTASVLLASVWPIVHAISGLLAGYLLSALMFYTGQWGGADAKMLMAVGAFQGFAFGALFSGSLPLFLSTFLSFLFVGAVYSLLYAVGLAIANRKFLVREFVKRYSSRRLLFVKVLVLFMLGVLIILLVFDDMGITAFMISLLLIFIIFSYVMFLFGRLLEKSILVQIIPVSKVTVGDWIVEDVYAHGKRICGPKDLGISEEQIKSLKQSGVRRIRVKYGIPFLPGFLLGYIFILIFGNWLPHLIALL